MPSYQKQSNRNSEDDPRQFAEAVAKTLDQTGEELASKLPRHQGHNQLAIGAAVMAVQRMARTRVTGWRGR